MTGQTLAQRNYYGKALAELAGKRSDVVVLDADLAGSTKTSDFQKVCPERFVEVGIAEQNMIGIAAGLAASGKTAFASTFGVFATRRWGRTGHPTRHWRTSPSCVPFPT